MIFGGGRRRFSFGIGAILAEARFGEVAIFAVLRCFSWVFVSTVQSYNARCKGEQMAILKNVIPVDTKASENLDKCYSCRHKSIRKSGKMLFLSTQKHQRIWQNAIPVDTKASENLDKCYSCRHKSITKSAENRETSTLRQRESKPRKALLMSTQKHQRTWKFAVSDRH